MTSIAVVTGADQGLGRALVDGLALRLGPMDNVYRTGRDATRVADAAGELRDAGLHVLAHRVDVTGT